MPISFFIIGALKCILFYGSLKKIVVLANRILDIELTKFCFCPNKFVIFQENLFVKPTKELVIVLCLTKLFVRRTKILLGQQRKVYHFYIFPVMFF